MRNENWELGFILFVSVIGVILFQIWSFIASITGIISKTQFQIISIACLIIQFCFLFIGIKLHRKSNRRLYH